MCYLHTFPVLHRNLQPRNVLLGENLNAKLSDFGFYETKVQSNYYVHLRKQCKGKNTKKPLYLAPEVIERNEYSVASDVYAFGKCTCIAEHIQLCIYYNIYIPIYIIYTVLIVPSA